MRGFATGVGSKADIAARATLGWGVRQLGALEGEGVEFLNSTRPGIRWTE